MSADPPEPSPPEPRDDEAARASLPAGGPREDAPRALRLTLAAEDAPRLRRHPLLAALGEGRRATRSALHQVYWDTPDLDVAACGLALRMHRAGQQSVQVVETPDGVGLAGAVRREHHALLPGDRPDLALVPDLDCRARLAAAVGTKSLAPVFEVQLERSRRLLEEDGAALRLDLEAGEIRSAWGTLPICDVEIAGRGGRPHRLAVELLDDVRLRPLSRSIAERAVERIAGRGPATHKARAVEAPPAALLDELLAAVAESGLAQLVENEAAAALGLDPEGVHQMRVGARRLRSAMGFFAPVLPERAREALRAELRWLAGELGPARDLDVFAIEGLDPLLAVRPGDEALARLRAAAEDARAAAHARVRDALAGPRWPRLALEAGGWIARRAWREQALGPDSARLFLPAQAFAAPVLEQRHRRARKLGRRLPEASPADRHRLRIRLKKLRYAAEFAACLHPGRRAERYAKRLARLQDALGHLNDVANAERQLAILLGPAPPADAPHAAGFVEGWLAHSAHVEAARLAALWERFEAAPRFWRGRVR